MSAVAVAGAHRGWEDAGHGDGDAARTPGAGPAQPRLFALPGGALDAVAVTDGACVSAVDEAPQVASLATTAPRPAMALAPVPTLDEVLGSAWGALVAGTAADCPLCHGRLRPRWSAGHGAVGGRCQDCGTVVD